MAVFFQLSQSQAQKIYDEVMNVVKQWRKLATEIGISRQEQEQMKFAFNI